MDLKERWKEGGKQRWTSSWTNCTPRPSGHIYFSELVWPHQVNYQVWPLVYSLEFHLTATECHLPYGITQCYLPPTQQ